MIIPKQLHTVFPPSALHLLLAFRFLFWLDLAADHKPHTHILPLLGAHPKCVLASIVLSWNLMNRNVESPSPPTLYPMLSKPKSEPSSRSSKLWAPSRRSERSNRIAQDIIWCLASPGEAVTQPRQALSICGVEGHDLRPSPSRTRCWGSVF